MPLHDNGSSIWFSRGNRRSSARIRLFCFPYAAGNSSIFKAWPKLLFDAVDICPINLPGRGIRFHEKPYQQLTPLVQELVSAMAAHLDLPFAFFGHSLGGLIAFELAQALRAEGLNIPLCLFVSACRAPRLDLPSGRLHDAPDDELLAKLRRLNGTPGEILDNRELMSMMLPTLRADFALWETYRYAHNQPLECPIVAFGGIQDHGTGLEQLEPWREETLGSFSLHLLPGDHFFIHSQEATLLNLIARHLDVLVLKAA